MNKTICWKCKNEYEADDVVCPHCGASNANVLPNIAKAEAGLLKYSVLFVAAFKDMQANIHQTARDKGWWDKERNDGELIALMHSELSEALEALRHGNPPDDKVPEFSGIEAELADVVIRIMDAAEARGWNVAGAIAAKAEMNKTRARMHGGKAF